MQTVNCKVAKALAEREMSLGYVEGELPDWRDISSGAP